MRPSSWPSFRQHLTGNAGAIGLVAALLLSLPAAVPLLLVRFPETHDGLLSLQRLLLFDDQIGAGQVFPRLYPDLASGYGYLLGNYYPPLSLYLAEIPMLLGIDPRTALALAFAGSLLVGGVGAYLLGRAVFSSAWAGLLCAAVFLYAPYTLANAYVRGALAECWGVALTPWVFWTLFRWRGGLHRFMPTAIALGLLVVAHNLVALFTWPLAALWWLALTISRGQPRRDLLRLPLPFLAGAALAAFYWLPAALEAGAVSLGRFAGKPTTNLLTIPQLVGPNFFYDYAHWPLRLGSVQAVVVALGVAGLAWVAIRRRTVTIRWPAWLAAAGYLFCVVMVSALASPFWSALGVLDSVQFPWRLLGLAALLGGLAVAPLALNRYGGVLTIGLAALMMLAGLGGLRLQERRVDPLLLTEAGIARWEFVDRSFATTISGEYLPNGVYSAFVHPADGVPDTGDTSAEPAVVVTGSQPVGALAWDVQAEAKGAAPLRFHAFWYPGWSATLDGQPADTYASTPMRLLTVDVPPGKHQIAIRFGTTLPRQAGLAMSVLGLAILLAVLAGPVRGWRARRTAVAAGIGLAALALVGAGWLTQQRRDEPGVSLMPMDLGDVRLAGGWLETSHDGRVVAHLIWQAREANPGDERFEIRLRGEDGAVVADAPGKPIWNTISPRGWTKNEVVREQRFLQLPPGLPPQTYQVEAATERAGAVVGKIALAGTGRPVGDSPAALNVSHGALRLLGSVISGTGADHEIGRGSTVNVTLHWQATAPPDDDYAFIVNLLGPTGARLDQSVASMANGAPPTALWHAGDQTTTAHDLHIPPNAPPGRYLLQVSVQPFRTSDPKPDEIGLLLLDPLKLRMEQEPPTPQVAVSLKFGDWIELLGYSLEDDGDTLVLAWRAVAQPPEDYTIFVHLLDANGNIVAQADSPPLNGGYPTSLWSPGEYVTDRIALPDAPGAVRARFGLYSVVTGKRLTAGGKESLEFDLRR